MSHPQGGIPVPVLLVDTDTETSFGAFTMSSIGWRPVGSTIYVHSVAGGIAI